MKTLFALLLATGVGAVAHGAHADSVMTNDLPIGLLPNGTYYVKNEVDFAPKEPRARALSPVDANRRAVDVIQLKGIHPGIAEIVGGHTGARLWLGGQPLPERFIPDGVTVPMIARSLKARLQAGEDAAQVVEALKNHPDVEWASLNILHPITEVPNDTLWSQQWGPPRVRADDAWEVAPASTIQRIAIIDSGVDLTHPDLVGRIVYNQGFGSNTDGDAKRDQRGGNSIDHGTHCAGIAAAIRNNGRGIAGVAQANIMAMGCASWNAAAGKYAISSAGDAIFDAVANSADIISCSFSMSSLSSASYEYIALEFAQILGVLVIAAAGNDSNNVDSSPSQGWNDHDWPLIVSNTQSDDTLWSSSNYGQAIDLAAPGTLILSTVTTNYQAANANGNYTNLTGTSMSAPHVAGGAAMVKSMNPNLITGQGIKSLLYRMAEDLGASGKDDNYGNGMFQLVPAFLETLKDADAFVSPAGLPLPFGTGHFNAPYSLLAIAIGIEAEGSTLVLNGGNTLLSSFYYPAITITKACTLKAFPDRPVTIGK